MPKSLVDAGWPKSAVGATVRVILDNDFAGDPDGLVQLAHHLLSPSVEIVGIIGTRHLDSRPLPPDTSFARDAVFAAGTIADLCGRSDVAILQGADASLHDRSTPQSSPGAQLIVNEARREDERPLFVCCGASLTEVASAWLIDPEIAERLTVVWIGGRAYDQSSTLAEREWEYNFQIDPVAAQVVFNDSRLSLWQFPRDVYRQAMVSRSELLVRMAEMGPLGERLWYELGQYPRMFASTGKPRNETYCLGDSPLVLATALQSFFDCDAASSRWIDRPCPELDMEGHYRYRLGGRGIRVFTQIDNRIWLEDFYAKLLVHARR